ncbi:hypothetical protein DFQ09_111126 [Winogradskyella pacifica]|uniref:Uncharacterized protein n=1 Tax=Winogradskyella pacifica TaxID=664642 RepID=A0A3D9LMC0_9FLAO|nr:DUF6520 family protein [Winogradskyella pacifica]REE07796.1 hypothetical protein DFQ09_111126 [Winogradskyella pacifica]
MKSLKVKILVPVLAVVFAITASAFTTVDNVQIDSNASMQGYIYQSATNPCHQVSVPNCSIDGEQTCFYSPGVIAKRLTGTSCPLPLKRNL